MDGPTLASSLIASAARKLRRDSSDSVDHQRGTQVSGDKRQSPIADEGRVNREGCASRGPHFATKDLTWALAFPYFQFTAPSHHGGNLAVARTAGKPVDL